MPEWAKKVLAWLLAIFCLYAIVTKPETAGDFVGGIWDIVREGLSNVLVFFDALLNR